MSRSLKILQVAPASLTQKGALDLESEVLGLILTGGNILGIFYYYFV